MHGNNITYFETNDPRLLAYFRNNDLIIINPTILEKQIELNSIKELVFKEGNITIKDQKIILGGQSIVIVRI